MRDTIHTTRTAYTGNTGRREKSNNDTVGRNYHFRTDYLKTFTAVSELLRGSDTSISHGQVTATKPAHLSTGVNKWYRVCKPNIYTEK